MAATLDTHTVVLDGQGKIIPWTTNPGDGYDRVMFLSWDLLLNRILNDPNNGLPAYYTHSEYDPNSLGGEDWPNNAAGKHAMLADSARMYYFYSGNTGVVSLVTGLLNYHLLHGTTPANYFWASVPYSTAKSGSTTYGNDDYSEGVGVLEPDKIGELGYHGYLKFYELTGNTNYLNAAIQCADQLALHIRTGDSTHSPWAFRVVAQTGATSQSEEYCADVIAPIRLFDELIRLGLGNTSAYQTARQTAWNWLMTYPMNNQVWANYFEDVMPRPNDLGNLNQYDPGETARYLLEHPELDANWYNHATNLLGFIETTFGGTDNGEAGLEYGARVISEQNAYRYKMVSHTSRFAADYALLYALTGDTNAEDKAYRSLNWCTYMCRANGVVIEGPAEFVESPACWFTDGHGDYIRHFMLALGAVPEWAPAGQNHITGSTTVIRSVTYASDSNSVAYTTFDGASTESLRVAFVPAAVTVNGVLLPQRSDLTQPGWVFNASNGVLRIRHDTGTSVLVSAQSSGNPPPTITTGSLPDGIMNASYSASLAASGGTTPYTWSITSGPLPAGLVLNANSGVITGTPTSAGMWSFTIQVRDASNPSQTAAKGFTITINSALTSVAVSPVNPTITNGTSQQFTATGTYSDGSAQNITAQTTWTSSSNAVTVINGGGLATAVSAGTATINASLAGQSGNSTLTVLPASIMTFGNGTIGNTNEGTSTDYLWSNGAWINAGRFQAGINLTVSTMRAKVAAISGKYKCAIYTDNNGQPSRLLRATTEVSNPGSGWQTFPLTSSLSLTNGQYYWLAIWSDNANAGVYYLASNGTLRWGSYAYGTWPDPISTSGGNNFNYCIYAMGTGATLTNVSVAPAAPTIVAGSTQQFTATGTYSDGSAQNITSQATWTSSSPAVATINASGLANASAAGTTTISATLAGKSANSLLTVQSPVAFTTSSLANGTVNVSYAATLAATGGTTPYTWSLASGSLPAGLTLDPASGAIAGTPTNAGTFNFTVRVNDAGNPVQTVTRSLSIVILTTLTSITVTPETPTILVGGTQQFTATGTYSDGSAQNITSEATWTSSSPAVATINASGLAMAAVAGSTTITATLAGKSDGTVLTVQSPLAITTSALTNGTVNVSYAATLAATGGTTPYTWSLASGSLPAGLTLDPASGAIAGTPTNAGTSSFTVRVSDAGNPAQTVTRSLSIAVVTTVTNATIWPASAVPKQVDGGADSPVELGVKFRSDAAGTINGIRFYKANANTGTHVGNLWTVTGTRLATATFTGETASGWQQVNFATPVSVSANTVYVASYHANNGHYSADENFFSAAGVDNPPLHALRNGVSGGDGVYSYGTSSLFPNQTWNTANYWVDVVFKPATP